MSREYTNEEMIDMFMGQIKGSIQYWATTDLSKVPDMGKDEMKYRLEGLAFSILNIIDGTTALPAFLLIPDPHPDDKKYHEDNEENYWPPVADEDPVACAINLSTNLHETFHRK